MNDIDTIDHLSAPWTGKGLAQGEKLLILHSEHEKDDDIPELTTWRKIIPSGHRSICTFPRIAGGTSFGESAIKNWSRLPDAVILHARRTIWK